MSKDKDLSISFVIVVAVLLGVNLSQTLRIDRLQDRVMFIEGAISVKGDP